MLAFAPDAPGQADCSPPEIADTPHSFHRLLSRWCGQMQMHIFLFRSSPRAGLPAAAPGPPSRDQLVATPPTSPRPRRARTRTARRRVRPRRANYHAPCTADNFHAPCTYVTQTPGRSPSHTPRHNLMFHVLVKTRRRARRRVMGYDQLVTARRSRSCSGKPRAG